MALEQLYIESLNAPAIQFEFSKNHFEIIFKHGKISNNTYLSMVKEIKCSKKLTILQHSQNLFTFCIIRGLRFYLLGPEILTDILSNHQFSMDQKTIYLPRLLNTISLSKRQCYKQLLVFARLIGLDLNDIQIDNAFAHPVISQEFNNKLVLINFNDQGMHVSYAYEKALKAAIEMGQPALIHDSFSGLINSGRIGILSDESQVRNIKNWGIICVSVMLRTAITAGVDYEKAYSLNDHYVRTLETLHTHTEIVRMIEIMLKDIAQRVGQLKLVHLSASVRRAYQIILNSPESKITVVMLSNQLGLSSHYLAPLFKKEIGVTIGRFRILVKVNRTIQLLHTTNLPLSEIAAILSFSDQAHLTREFKKFVGVTPTQARRNPHLTDDWHLYNFIKINLG